MKEIGNLKFCRAVIPKDAVSLDVELIHSADAGENLICAAVHARYKLRNGNFSCQLIFARTKIVHDLTIPRAELEAALLNATTGHTVIKALKNGIRAVGTSVTAKLHYIGSIAQKLR